MTLDLIFRASFTGSNKILVLSLISILKCIESIVHNYFDPEVQL